MTVPQSASLHLLGDLLFHTLDYRILSLFFRLFPHSDPRMNLAEFLIYNPLASSWIFAAAYYFYWRQHDERTAEERCRLLEIIPACIAAALISLALTHWFGEPSPARNPSFQALFPPYLCGSGAANSFPSHATLVYLIVALGLWPFSRRCSAALSVWVLLAVSLPRVYMGGHYPSDVFWSMILAFAFLWLARVSGRTPLAKKAYGRIAAGGLWVELLLFLWLFELAEGFHASLEIAHLLVRVAT